MTKRIELDIEWVKTQYLLNRSTKEIADDLGCNATTIQQVLKPFGILRKKGARTRFTEQERRKHRRESDKAYNSSEAAKKSHRKRCEKDRQKVRARWTVENAIRRGVLPRVSTQECKDCGVVAQEYDHYLGYSEENMLNVEPVCSKCNKLRIK